MMANQSGPRGYSPGIHDVAGILVTQAAAQAIRAGGFQPPPGKPVSILRLFQLVCGQLPYLLVMNFPPVFAAALALALLSAGPALAQKTAAKAKNDKIKTKTTSAAGAVTKSKVTMPPAPIAAPQPTSPVASAPQVLVAATPMHAPAGVPAAAEMPAGWLADLGAARAAATAANRPILAVFSGSDWCKPCIMYEQEVFAKPEFVAYAKDKLVLAHFDFPRLKKNQPTAA